MADSLKTKQSLYFPCEMLEEIRAQAERLDRSMSWVVQRAWIIARAEIAKMAGVNDPSPAGRPDDPGFPLPPK